MYNVDGSLDHCLRFASEFSLLVAHFRNFELLQKIYTEFKMTNKAQMWSKLHIKIVDGSSIHANLAKVADQLLRLFGVYFLQTLQLSRLYHRLTLSLLNKFLSIVLVQLANSPVNYRRCHF